MQKTGKIGCESKFCFEKEEKLNQDNFLCCLNSTVCDAWGAYF